MRVYIGIDWSEQKHNVCVMNEAGAVLRQFVMKHSVEGFLALDEYVDHLGVAREEVAIGLETAHSLLIDVLQERAYPRIYVLPPNQVKDNAGRYAQSGAKDDERDAWVIADILRTDRDRHPAWQPNSLLTRQLRAWVTAYLFNSHQIRRYTNRLRSILLRYYPTLVELFSRLDQPLTLAFLQAYPDPRMAQQLSYEQFTHLMRSQRTQRKTWEGCYQRLVQAQPKALPDTIAVLAPQAQRLAVRLGGLCQEKHLILQQLKHWFALHPDAPTFASLPAARNVLAPALLAKLGDDRQRFPSPQVLQAVAGTCPITKRSGKHRAILFRRRCDRQLRYLAHQWAVASIRTVPWIKGYYQLLLKRNIPKNAATRRVANRLMAILWKLWQSHTTYDADLHLQNRLARAKPLPRA